MSRLKKLAILFIFAVLVAMLPCYVEAASDFDLKKLSFDATLTADGDMQVTENWQVKINGTTNTLFKTFEPDSSKYSRISNVRVAEIQNGTRKEFSQSTQWKNHVDTNYFHALMYSGDFEIAWGVNQSSGTHTYTIQYTVEDVVTVYEDCAELYWQFIGADFEVPIDEVTGTIHLPNKVSNMDNLRVWGHGTLNGEITREDEQTVQFRMAPFITGNYLEVRMAVLDKTMFAGAVRTKNQEALNNIIGEETTWAGEANAQREKAKRIVAFYFWGAVIVSGIIGAILIYFIIKNLKKIKETPKLEPNQELEYFRDIPNETSTPSEVGLLYYYGKASMNMVMPRILSSTMLDLALKKCVAFEMNQEASKKEQITFKLIENQASETLKKSEKLIYDLLKMVAKEKNSFTMKDFEKYAKDHNAKFLDQLNDVEEAAKKEQEEAENYSKETQKQHDNWRTKGVVCLVILVFLSMFLMGLLELNVMPIAMMIICVVIYALTCFNIAGRYSGLTQKGINEQEQWKGLKRYMQDFSLIKDREVPELVLWEKYLVYATLFGNAQKVLEQLKVVYPQFSDDDYIRNTTYFYLLAHTDFSHSFITTVNSAVERAYRESVASSSSSSGGGYGGGFSGGGGGRRWRRPEAADAKTREKERKTEVKKGKDRKNNQNNCLKRHNFGYFAIILNIPFEKAYNKEYN